MKGEVPEDLVLAPIKIDPVAPEIPDPIIGSDPALNPKATLLLPLSKASRVVVPIAVL